MMHVALSVCLWTMVVALYCTEVHYTAVNTALHCEHCKQCTAFTASGSELSADCTWQLHQHMLLHPNKNVTVNVIMTIYQDDNDDDVNYDDIVGEIIYAFMHSQPVTFFLRQIRAKSRSKNL